MDSCFRLSKENEIDAMLKILQITAAKVIVSSEQQTGQSLVSSCSATEKGRRVGTIFLTWIKRDPRIDVEAMASTDRRLVMARNVIDITLCHGLNSYSISMRHQSLLILALDKHNQPQVFHRPSQSDKGQPQDPQIGAKDVNIFFVHPTRRPSVELCLWINHHRVFVR